MLKIERFDATARRWVPEPLEIYDVCQARHFAQQAAEKSGDCYRVISATGTIHFCSGNCPGIKARDPENLACEV